MALVVMLTGLALQLGALVYMIRNVTSKAASPEEKYRNHMKAMIFMGVCGLVSGIGFLFGGGAMLEWLLTS